MNRAQKIAWFNLIVIAVSLSFTGGAVTILALVAGVPKALSGLGFLGICGIMGFSPLLFKKNKGPVVFDERDELIQKKASLAGFAASYLFFVAVCMVTWFIYGPKGSVSVSILPMTVIGGLIVVMLGQSVVILDQYGRKGKSGPE